ncbi:MAG TPA: hypothetical protein ENI27_07635 [bacterium]|nr:hypothetical protein [bacterium]
MTPGQANLAVTLAVAGGSLGVGVFLGWVIAHGYYLKQKKDSDKQYLKQKKESDQLPEKFGKYLEQKMPAILESWWKTSFPQQPITPEVKASFADIVKSTSTVLVNFDYTAFAEGLKLWGEAGTIGEGTVRKMPPTTSGLIPPGDDPGT